MILPLLMVTILTATPSEADALVGVWGVQEHPFLALYPERVATAGAGAWMWTHEASHRIQLVSPGGQEPAQELPYRLDGGKLVITLPPIQQAGSLRDLAMMALSQGQQAQQVEKGATLVLEPLPYPPEMIGPYSKTAPEALSDQYVRASGHIFHIRQGFSALLSGSPAGVERLPGADAASFQVISDSVARDRQHVYCPELLPQADGASFSPVPNKYGRWFRDRAGVWLGCSRQLKLLPGQAKGVPFDPSSFEVLSSVEVKDRDGTFRQTYRSEPEPPSPGTWSMRQAGIWLRPDDPRSKQEKLVPVPKPVQQTPPLLKRPSR